LEYILEPKGAKAIPGFSFKDIERQKQYVNFLGSSVFRCKVGRKRGEGLPPVRGYVGW
jgi:hypothetical protein